MAGDMFAHEAMLPEPRPNSSRLSPRERARTIAAKLAMIASL
jgi:hypothetical protein